LCVFVQLKSVVRFLVRTDELSKIKITPNGGGSARQFASSPPIQGVAWYRKRKEPQASPIPSRFARQAITGVNLFAQRSNRSSAYRLIFRLRLCGQMLTGFSFGEIFYVDEQKLSGSQRN
jgi:hypothetical protein